MRGKQTKAGNRRNKSQKANWLSVVVLYIIASIVAWTFLLNPFSQNPRQEYKTDSRVIIVKYSFTPEPANLTINPVVLDLQAQGPEKQLLPPPDYELPGPSEGLAPVISHIDTTQPVVFLGIDDGWTKQDFQLQLIKDESIKATLFLTFQAIEDNPGFFSDFQENGLPIENHTVTHTILPTLNYEQQKAEICGGADKLATLYGRRPVLFRPPGGEYNLDTQRAAYDCGMKAIVNWVAKANGSSMQYQEGDKLKPGDIVLMHFRPEFKEDLQAFLTAANASSLRTELLEDWLQ